MGFQEVDRPLPKDKLVSQLKADLQTARKLMRRAQQREVGLRYQKPVEAAVLAEREACAKIAEEMSGKAMSSLGDDIAAKIRGRAVVEAGKG